jgi:CPA2 family monovalent cation:H+ antiporter-2
VTLFFTSIGMLIDPGWLFRHLPSVLAGTAAVFVVKSVVIYFVLRFFRIEPLYALATGILLGQVGEFSFVLATAAQAGGLIGGETFAWAVSVTILSLFLSPYMVAYAQPLAKATLARLSARYRDSASSKEVQADASCGTFVIGFGPAGREVADALLRRGLPPVVVELNPKTASLASSKGLAVHIGDATAADFLEHAGLKAAGIAVVSVPDPRASAAITRAVRHLAPRALLIVRCRYHLTRRDLEKAGADVIVDEEPMVGRELAREVVGRLPEDQLPAMACVLAGRDSGRPVPERDPKGD